MNGRIKRDDAQSGRMPLLGKLKIGEKKEVTKNGNTFEIPVSLDYFRADGKYAAVFHKNFGEKPDKLQIIFVSNDIRQVCNERYEWRKSDKGNQKGSKLFADGDGETFRVWDTTKDDYTIWTIEQRPTIMADLDKACGKDSRKTVLTLRFVIPALKGLFGVWQFSTRGENTMAQIVSVFDLVLEKAKSIINIPFDLVVEKVTSQKPGAAHTFPIVTLIPNLSNESLELVGDYLDHGAKVRGLLTEDKVNSLALEYNGPEAETEDLPQEPTAGAIIDAELVKDPPLADDISADKLKKAGDLLLACKTIEAYNEAIHIIELLKLTQAENDLVENLKSTVAASLQPKKAAPVNNGNGKKESQKNVPLLTTYQEKILAAHLASDNAAKTAVIIEARAALGDQWQELIKYANSLIKKPKESVA